jgi:hypothetical protein
LMTINNNGYIRGLFVEWSQPIHALSLLLK